MPSIKTRKRARPMDMAAQRIWKLVVAANWTRDRNKALK
jgi:hypothetical protein